MREGAKSSARRNVWRIKNPPIPLRIGGFKLNISANNSEKINYWLPPDVSSAAPDALASAAGAAAFLAAASAFIFL